MKRLFGVLTAISALAAGTQALALNLVTNGSFETTSSGAGEFGPNGFTVATGWSSAGYNFIFAPGTADTTGSYTSQYSAYLSLWGTNNGGNDVIPATSPDGGNFIAMDGAFENGAVSQTITGLTPGKTYAVTFDYAFAQQNGFNGPTLQNITVSLGGSSATVLPSNYALGSHDFSGWSSKTLTFTADGTSDLLSFLAYGDQPVPPFALIDGVSLTAVPEPATWTMLILGIGGIGGLARRRRAAGLSAATAA